MSLRTVYFTEATLMNIWTIKGKKVTESKSLQVAVVCTAKSSSSSLLELLAQILPILHHQLLDTKQCFISDIWIFVGEPLHD